MPGFHVTSNAFPQGARRRRRFSILRGLLPLLFVIVRALPAAAQLLPCPSGPVSLTDGQWLLVVGDCEIDGDITMTGRSALYVAASNLLVRGNISLDDQALLYVHDSEMTIDNEFNTQYSITASGSSIFWLSSTVFRTDARNLGSLFMAYAGHENSSFVILNSSAPVEASWLIARLDGQARLLGSGAADVPSEVVVSDAATVRLLSGSRTALWMPFPPASKATLRLPDQTGGNYSFAFGRTTPGVVGIAYQIEILDSAVRLHLNSSPASTLLVIGKGSGPAGAGEVSVGILMTGVTSPQTVSGLRPGYQMFTYLTHQNRNLILLNVDVDPVGWNVYVAGASAPVTIEDSVLNEVASFSAGWVEVNDSILQFAVLGSTGNGSRLTINNSHIFSQAIHASGDGTIEVNDSFIHGSVLESKDQGEIQIDGGLQLPNGEAPTCAFASALTEAAIPLCNPFVEPGALPVTRIIGDGEVLFGGTPPADVTDLHLVGWSDTTTVQVGGLLTTTVQVGNEGPSDASGATVRFKTPQGAVVDSFSPACSIVGPDVICTIGDLPRQTGSDLHSVTYQALVALPIIGHVTVTGNQADPDPSNHHLRFTTTVTP